MNPVRGPDGRPSAVDHLDHFDPVICEVENQDAVFALERMGTRRIPIIPPLIPVGGTRDDSLGLLADVAVYVVPPEGGRRLLLLLIRSAARGSGAQDTPQRHGLLRRPLRLRVPRTLVPADNLLVERHGLPLPCLFESL